MKELKIYLAGRMSGLSFDEMNSWREETKRKLLNKSNSLYVINPVDYYNFKEPMHQSEREVKEYDLAHVRSSDVVIVNLDGLQNSDGTKYELHEANYQYKIPVIAFGNKNLYDNLHPWTKDNITRVETNIDDVISYIYDFYCI